MTWNPEPVVTIDGLEVAAGTPGDGTLGLARMVLDGFTVTWGRADVFAQPEPATGTLRLFDPPGYTSDTGDLRGRTVTIAWRTPTESKVFFRGRIGAPLTLTRRTVTSPDGSSGRGTLTEVPLVSVLVDLANRTPDIAFPAETLGARKARLATLCADVLPGGIFVRSYWEAPQVAPVALADQVTLWEHLLRLYDSTGADRLAYNPHTQYVINRERRDHPTVRGTAALQWKVAGDPDSNRAGQGAYAVAISPASMGRYTYLDARETAYPDDAGITQPEKITFVELTHPDAGNGYADRTVVVPVEGTVPARDGTRTVRLESQVAWNAYADVAAADLEDLAHNEGADWQLAPLTVSTRYLGGFPDDYLGQQLLAGVETAMLYFVQRSFLSEYGLRPVLGILGQTIGYSDGGWDVECRTSPVNTTLPQHPISWSEIDDGSATYELRWSDGPDPRGLHESLTYEDIGWVAAGMGASPVTIGPDTGWDIYE
jgi:hypothetical protein